MTAAPENQLAALATALARGGGPLASDPSSPGTSWTDRRHRAPGRGDGEVDDRQRPAGAACGTAGQGGGAEPAAAGAPSEEREERDEQILSGDTLANILAVAATRGAAPAREVRLARSWWRRSGEHPGCAWESLVPSAPVFTVTADMPSFPGFQVHRIGLRASSHAHAH